MTFEEMKQLEPELQRLSNSAEHAGASGSPWLDVLDAMHQALSKLTGRGALDERLQTAQAYETARRGLYMAWLRGTQQANDAGGCCCISNPDATLPNTAHSEAGYRRV